MSSALPCAPGFSFGADPEIFIINGDGEPVCADGLIPGTKLEPYKVAGGAVQVDGFAAEFNIDPARTFKEFNGNISKVLRTLKRMLPQGYGFTSKASIVFSEKVWDEAPEHAKELGCTPDFNAWTGKTNPPPDLPDNPRLRSAAGHIHIGWRGPEDDYIDEAHVNNCREFAKQLDFYLGAWSLNYDMDTTRRKLYGRAGAIRYKPYGVEYRVLSNFWLFNPEYRLEVWNRLQTAIADMRDMYIPELVENPCNSSYYKGYDFNDACIEVINHERTAKSLKDCLSYPVKTLSPIYKQGVKNLFQPTELSV